MGEIFFYVAAFRLGMVVKKGAGNFHKEGEFLYSARVPCSIGRIYLHQNNKLFGARKEKFMGCFILAEIH